MKIIGYLVAVIIVSTVSITIYEQWFGPSARMDERLQEYYHCNIQAKCGITDNDYMNHVWAKISTCLDHKDITIGELNSLIHQN